jgi:hypothetical protein
MTKQRTAVQRVERSLDQRLRDDTRRFLRFDADYWNKTGVPEGIARAKEIATGLDDQAELPLADLHRAWCATFDDMQTYACASIHTEAKRKEIRRLLDIREDVMTELFARMTEIERRGKCRSS